MVKISFLLPDDATLNEVHRISQEQDQPLELVKTGNQGTLRQTVDQMLQNGTEIFISRGFLAKELTAMHLFNAAGVPSAGDVGGEGIALDVYENCADDYDSHI